VLLAEVWAATEVFVIVVVAVAVVAAAAATGASGPAPGSMVGGVRSEGDVAIVVQMSMLMPMSVFCSWVSRSSLQQCLCEVLPSRRKLVGPPPSLFLYSLKASTDRCMA